MVGSLFMGCATKAVENRKSTEYTMKMSEDGAKRVQENCISCHKSIVSTITSNADKYHNYDSPEVATGRRCWECHKSVPHGKVRAINTTPNNLGVKEVK